jgi:cell division protein FtsB
MFNEKLKKEVEALEREVRKLRSGLTVQKTDCAMLAADITSLDRDYEAIKAQQHGYTCGINELQRKFDTLLGYLQVTMKHPPQQPEWVVEPWKSSPENDRSSDG